MKAIIGSSDSDEIPKPKSTKNKIVMDLIGATFNKCSLTIDNVRNLTVKYLSMMVINKIYYTKRENYVSATGVHGI